MKPGKSPPLWAALVAPTLLFLAHGATPAPGDEPGRLGRWFRFGNPSTSSAVRTQSSPEGDTDRRPMSTFANPAPPVSRPTSTASNAAQPRIVPQPRVSRAFTDADPLVTRVSLGRSDDGTQFGMFLQVYADGTVIDSEGVHHVGREAIKEVLNALELSDLSRIKGHCGGPSTDFVEQVQMVVYDRSLGRLRANAFSFSGNTQGCDHSVRHLQATLEALQARISRPAPGAVPSRVPTHGVPAQTPMAAPLQLGGGISPLED